MVVPDFVGMGVLAVTKEALENRLPLEIVGTGIAYEQVPEPGALLEAGDRMVVRFRVGATGRPASSKSPETAPGRRRVTPPATAAAALPASG
jgi:hypothetical protein